MSSGDRTRDAHLIALTGDGDDLPAMVGRDIRGGCVDCDAVMRVEKPFADLEVYAADVFHATTCPTLLRQQ